MCVISKERGEEENEKESKMRGISTMSGISTHTQKWVCVLHNDSQNLVVKQVGLLSLQMHGDRGIRLGVKDMHIAPAASYYSQTLSFICLCTCTFIMCTCIVYTSSLIRIHMD